MEPIRRTPGLAQIVGATAVALGGTIASVYMLNRLRRHRKTQALLDTLPPTTDVDIEDHTAEPADDVYDPAELINDTADSYDDLTYGQLHQIARQRDVVGHSSMGKPELLAALREADTNLK